MTAWSHLPTIFVRQRILIRICLGILSAVFSTTLLFANPTSAAPSNQTINFSARLKSTSGAVVPDGYYNIGFRLYSQETAGSPLWTEIYHDINGATAGGDNRIRVVNGYLNVKLGSLQAFSGIDWSSDLWLTMDIGGTAQEAVVAQIDWDGEMTPRIQLSAVPYAMSAGTVGGKSADQFVQLGQGTQTDAGNFASIAINKTGSGQIVRLQADGSDVFSVGRSGSITMGSASNQSISIATSASGAGRSLTISAGSAAASGTNLGGDLVLQGGAGSSTSNGGSVIVKSSGNDNTSAFQVQNAAGETVLNVDATNQKLTLGNIEISSPTDANGVGQTVSLWPNSYTPSGSPNNDGTPLNLGTVFKSSVAGQVTGVKFYRPDGANGNGSDIGKLWACNDPLSCSPGSGGTELASVNFAADTTPGWKTATFSNPVAITPDTYYIVTYYTTHGAYYSDSQHFTTARSNGPLYAPANSTVTNGRFIANSSGFPTGNWMQSSYFVDVTFQPFVKTDSLISSGNLLLGSDGAMTIGPSADSLTVQGSAVDIHSNNVSIGTSGGSTTVKSSFAVQNAANANQLAVDTVNSRVTIGTSDTTGTLLVLDTKTDAGDPTGINGAMYYNSSAGKFRCFENGAWIDCITPLPVSKVVQTDTTNSTTSPVDVADLEFTLAANTKYYYKFIVIHESADQAAGIGFGVTTPANPVMSNWCVNTTSTLTANTAGHWGSYCGVGDAAATTTGAENTGTNYTSTMEGYFQTGNDPGDLQLRMKSSTAAQTKVKAGSFGILQIVQ